MRTLSVMEFNDWQSRASPKEYVFATCNQNICSDDDMRVSLRFTQVYANPEICRISFKNGAGMDYLMLDRVKEVIMDDSMENFAAVIDFVCGDDPQHTYRFLAFI